jgi:kinesin family protein C1
MEEGVIQRAIKEVFNWLIDRKFTATVSCSMIELYFSQINDLLRPDHEKQKNIRIKTDQGYVHYENATKIKMNVEKNAAAKLINLFKEGLDNRIVRSTEANETSSRSHLLFTLKIKII